MLARALVLLAAVAPLAAPLGCGSGVEIAGARSFAEVDAAAAARAVDDEGARLVEVGAPGERSPGVSGERLAPDAPVPEDWLAEDRPVVVVAEDPADARRVAARLVRGGLPRVVVVRGGIQAWLAERPSPGAPATAQRRDPAGET